MLEIRGPERGDVTGTRLYRVLGGDRHMVVQMMLGHPDALPTRPELEYMTGLSGSELMDAVGVLTDAAIIDESRHQGHVFYGFTEIGVNVLWQYKYLNGLAVCRALHSQTEKTECVKKLQGLERPELPETVTDAVTF